VIFNSIELASLICFILFIRVAVVEQYHHHILTFFLIRATIFSRIGMVGRLVFNDRTQVTSIYTAVFILLITLPFFLHISISGRLLPLRIEFSSRFAHGM
jgi:hypothetical protein